MTTRVVETKDACREAVADQRAAGRAIALVPTMGALHEGHLSLVDRARELADFTVLSVFVNPLQFGPLEDYDRYPRDLTRDVALAGERGVDLVFAPSVEEMYPRPPLTRVTMEGITETLEGARRPGHFDGVLTVVAKLLHVVRPDVAVFGQKDAQQAAAIRRMVSDLDFPLAIEVAPIVREPDGLALSSRNRYLSAAERREALALQEALRRAADLVAGGETDAERIVSMARRTLEGHPDVDVDYVALVERDEFRPVGRLAAPCVLAVAARVGETRLIDNVVLEPHAG